MLEQLHLIAQYLAMAGKSFLPKQDDDGHTNLGYDSSTKCLETWPLGPAGETLMFQLHEFSLVWSSGRHHISLAGKTHAEVLT